MVQDRHNVSTLCVALHIIVLGEHVVCWLIIASPNLQTTNCFWKGRGYIKWPIWNF